MEQQNNILSSGQQEDSSAQKNQYFQENPSVQEEHLSQENPSSVAPEENQTNSSLLGQVRLKFNIFGGISLFFGIAFTACFYKAGVGINLFLFTIIMIGLLVLIMKRLSLPIKKATKVYYAGAALLGLSTMLTANTGLQFLNITGILLLLDRSLLHQFQEDKSFDFLKHIGRVFGLLFRSIASIGMPFADGVHFLRRTKVAKNNKALNIILGCIIALPVLMLVIALLSSADPLFGEITEKIFCFLFSPQIVHVILLIFFGFLACYGIICGAAKYADMGNTNQRRKEDPLIAITAIGLLTAVYLLFCGIQIIYLFSNGLFVLPTGYTFAEYARRGFFELLAVTIINIALIVTSTTLFHEHKVLKALLTVMTVCTYIMIASAAYRMMLYIDAYHLTFLRLLVLLFLFMDVFVLAGVIISVYRKKFPLFGYCVAVIASFYILFSFSRPDYRIALYHLNHKEEITMEDIRFLTDNLSYDAAPAVIPYLSDPKHWEQGKTEGETREETRISSKETEDWDWSRKDKEDYYARYCRRILKQQADRGLRDFNYSYYRAAQTIKQYQ